MVNSFVVVLGAKLDKDGKASKALRRRVVTGCDAFQTNKAVKVIMCGGSTHPSFHLSEAEVMRDLALENAIEKRDILLEDQSRNTLENALNCKALLEGYECDKVIVVTDQYHVLRSKITFRAAGFKNVEFVKGLRPSSYSTLFFSILREVPALIWYGLRILNGDHRRK